MANALGTKISNVQPPSSIGRRFAGLLWLWPLLVGLLLAYSGGVILAKVSALNNFYQHQLTPPLELVLRADAAFGWQIIVAGLVLFVWALTASAPVVRRLYPVGRPRVVCLAWNTSGFIWLVFYVLLASLLGVAGDQRIAAARIAAPLLLAVLCFAQGMILSTSGEAIKVSGRHLVGILALGFFIVALTDVFTFDATNAVVKQVGAAFQDSYVQRVQNSVSLSTDYWLVTPAGDSLLTPLLAVSPWLMLSYAYVLTLKTPYDLPFFFRCCPAYPPGLRQAIVFLLARRNVVYACVPGAMGILPIIIGMTFANQGPASSQVRQLASVFPIYVVLLLPAACRAWMIKDSRWDQAAVDTRRRDKVLSQEWPSLWLLLFSAGLVGGSLLLWAQRAGSPFAISVIDEIVQLIPLSASARVLWGFAAASLVSILIHYIGLVELPYRIGQGHWRAAEIVRAESALREAEAALRADLDGVPACREAVVKDDRATGRRLARYILAQEETRASDKIPLYSANTVVDLLRLSIQGLATTLVTTGLGFEEPNGTKELSNLVGEIIKRLFERG